MSGDKSSTARHRRQITEILESSPGIVVDQTLAYLLQQNEAISITARQGVEEFFARCGLDGGTSASAIPVRTTKLLNADDLSEAGTIETGLADIGIAPSDWPGLSWYARWEACQRIEEIHQSRLGASSDEVDPVTSERGT